MNRFDFNFPKFKELVLYVCHRCGPDHLGNVKLHKVLYFSDMFAYIRKGHPISGETYIKQQFGPTARHLGLALRELQSEGAVTITEVDYFGFRKKEYRAARAPDLRAMQDRGEVELVNAVCDLLMDKSAREVSELSHGVPWQVAGMGQEIPYHTAFSLMPTEVTDEDMVWAKGEVVRLAAE